MRQSPSGKVYVGQTMREAARCKSWFCAKHSYGGVAINNARKKYSPENWTYCVLCRINSDSLVDLQIWLNALEVYYIWLYNSHDKAYGYNSTKGGDGSSGYVCSTETKSKMRAAQLGKKLSESTKKKLSLAHVGKKASAETRSKMSSNRKGRKLSAEARANMSRAQKGRMVSEETRRKMSVALKGRKMPEGFGKAQREALAKPVDQYTTDGVFIRRWDCILDIERELGICARPVAMCCSKGGGYSNGFCWVYTGAAFVPRADKKLFRRRVGMFSPDGILLNEFDSIKSASSFVGVSSPNIICCCQGKLNSVKGYLWRYLDSR